MQKKDMSLGAEEFKQQIIDTINQAGGGLPPALVYYIMKDIFYDVSKTYKDYLSYAKNNEKEETLDEND